MDELLVIDKILDFIVPVKLRGKHMGVLMERGVKLLFLGVVAVIAIERILRKTIEAIGDTNQWSYAIGCMMLYLFITIMIYALVMGGINMFISMISDMKHERVVEAKLDVQESDVVLKEESIVTCPLNLFQTLLYGEERKFLNHTHLVHLKRNLILFLVEFYCHSRKSFYRFVTNNRC
jgi:hypothetical protein